MAVEEAVAKTAEIGIGSGIVAASAAFAIGAGALATAYAQASIGAANAGMLSEKPELTGNALLFLAIPETMVILGFVVAFLILNTLGAG